MRKFATVAAAGGIAIVASSPCLARDCTPRMPYTESNAIKHEMVAAIHGNMKDYELDHIVPLCLCGSNDRSNLQLQLWADARRKDRDEARLCYMVEHGEISRAAAQQQMRNWRP